jgi:hypothetical protein
VNFGGDVKMGERIFDFQGPSKVSMVLLGEMIPIVHADHNEKKRSVYL